jgi:hypothetical protein
VNIDFIGIQNCKELKFKMSLLGLTMFRNSQMRKPSISFAQNSNLRRESNARHALELSHKFHIYKLCCRL